MKKAMASLLLLLLMLPAMWDKDKPWPQGRKVTREVILGIPRPPMPPLPGQEYLKTTPKYIPLKERGKHKDVLQKDSR